jgi:hypothetical protein
MSKSPIELALKKQALLLESAIQRQQLAQHAEGLKPLFTGADRGLDALCWISQHPALVTAASVVALLMRPRFLWRMSLRGLYFWRLAKTLRGRR